MYKSFTKCQGLKENCKTISYYICRFTDSPEPGGKGRGKRCRNSATPQELEPRKNLRSSKGKGKGGKGNKFDLFYPSFYMEYLTSHLFFSHFLYLNFFYLFIFYL